MKKRFLALILFVVLISPAMAFGSATVTPGTTIISTENGGVEASYPITITADESGGGITGYALGRSGVLQLVEVEVVHGTSTASISVVNSRGTTVWSLAAMDATTNKIYGGHITTGVFPKEDVDWLLTVGTLDASDSVTIIFKFSSKP
jgi:hypothetical protein